MVGAAGIEPVTPMMSRRGAMRSKVLFEQDSFCPSLGRCPANTPIVDGHGAPRAVAVGGDPDI